MNHFTLLPIGAFSTATQLSAKALRLYAEHGILSPAKIDMDTGYRYYRPDQVQQARLVQITHAVGERVIDSRIVRAADTDELPSEPQAAGLLAISLGLGTNIADDDALYAWCKRAKNETHNWPFARKPQHSLT